MTMPTPLKAQAGRSSPDDNAPHILVVDDDSRIRDLLARYLQDNGFRVTTAIDAATAPEYDDERDEARRAASAALAASSAFFFLISASVVAE